MLLLCERETWSTRSLEGVYAYKQRVARVETRVRREISYIATEPVALAITTKRTRTGRLRREEALVDRTMGVCTNVCAWKDCKG